MRTLWRESSAGLGALLGVLFVPMVALAAQSGEVRSIEPVSETDAESAESVEGADPAPRPDTQGGQPRGPTSRPDAPLGLWQRPVRRGGFHLQVGFGVGGGPDTKGIFHTMELGWTFDQYTVAMLHTFIQNKDALGGTKGGPDLIGGWMFEFKAPLFFPDLVGKVALGLGGTHEQPDGGGIIAHSGFGASYGVDLHFPIWPRFGPTLTLAALHVTAQGQHHFGVGTALAVTLF